MRCVPKKLVSKAARNSLPLRTKLKIKKKSVQFSTAEAYAMEPDSGILLNLGKIFWEY